MSFEYDWEWGRAYGHRLLVPLTTDYRHIMYQRHEANSHNGAIWMKLMMGTEVREWILEQGWVPMMETSFRAGANHSYGSLRFANKKNALLFKLTWG